MELSGLLHPPSSLCWMGLNLATSVQLQHTIVLSRIYTGFPSYECVRYRWLHWCFHAGAIHALVVFSGLLAWSWQELNGLSYAHSNLNTEPVLK